MKIHLIFSVLNIPQDKGQDVGYSYGLGYIAAALKSAGHDVGYFSLTDNHDVRALCDAVRRDQPGIVAFSATSSQFPSLGEIVPKIKTISDSFVVCGGVHTTLKPECISEMPELDAVARGEGEWALPELADALEKGADIFNIRSFWFRNGAQIIKNETRSLIAKLDDLPFPDKTSLDYQQVIDKAGGVNRFIFSRGCPFDCSYCSNKALSDAYSGGNSYFRQRSPRKAIAEIERDAGAYNFRCIAFDDDVMSLNKKWFYEFFDLYRKNFRYPFRCNLRVGTVDSDMMRLLKDAGAQGIGVGIEHGNEEFRRKVLKRNISNKQILETFSLCDKYGLTHNDFIMVGFPYENRRLFLDTARLCRKVSAKGSISIFVPYPGTHLAAVCEANGWLPGKKKYVERDDAVISYPGFPKEEIQLCADTYELLMRFKFIPLWVPLEWIRWAYKLSRRMDDFVILRRVKRALRFVLR